jgi:hypothetical protein
MRHGRVAITPREDSKMDFGETWELYGHSNNNLTQYQPGAIWPGLHSEPVIVKGIRLVNPQDMDNAMVHDEKNVIVTTAIIAAEGLGLNVPYNTIVSLIRDAKSHVNIHAKTHRRRSDMSTYGVA